MFTVEQVTSGWGGGGVTKNLNVEPFSNVHIGN